MKKEKTIKQLLQLMLDHSGTISKKNNYGLCAVLKELSYDDIITSKEKDKAYKYIADNRPKKVYYPWRGGTTKTYSNAVYLWEHGVKAPRINWLKKHIKKSEL